MKHRWKRQAAAILAFACLFGNTVWAENRSESPLAIEMDGKDIILYVKDPGENVQAECQIGVGYGSSVEITPISAEEIPIETIFLVDNSASIQEKYRPMIADILTQLAANRMDREQFSLGVFSTQLTWLLENTSDYSQIKAAVESITYQDQETYLTDVLYELLKEKSDSCFKRIVIISDGMDDKAIGYTRDELYRLLEENPCPIYTLGCTLGSNQENLKSMFALSRMTQGEYWLVDEISDTMEVVSEICALNTAKKVTITPDEAACDGTTKGLQLNLTKSGETIQYVLELQMPFTESAEEDPEGTKLVFETTADAETVQAVVKTGSSGKKTSYKLIGASGIIIVFLVVIFCVIAFRKRRYTRANQNISDQSIEDEDMALRNRKTVLVSNEMDSSREQEHGRNTYLAWGRKISLTDQNHPEKRFTAGMNGNTILIGYNAKCQICLNYDESVSGEHCSLQDQMGKTMVRNLSKTNPTLVNGCRIEEEKELKSGDILTIGRLKMKVEIKL